MAKVKKSSKKNAAGKGHDKSSPQEQAERFTRSLSESAQQIWQAGVGAFGRAQAEGSKLFEGLAKEGATLEQTARKLAGQADVVRSAVESTVGQARERAAGTWDRLENVFEDRVQKALTKFGVPGREDISGLSRRVDTLASELRRKNAASAASAAAGKTSKSSSTPPAPAPAARKAPARKAAPPAARVVVKKTAAKKAGTKTTTARKAPTRPG